MHRLQPTVSNPGTAGGQKWKVECDRLVYGVYSVCVRIGVSGGIRAVCVCCVKDFTGGGKSAYLNIFIRGTGGHELRCSLIPGEGNRRSGRLFASSVQAVSRSMRWLSCSTGNIPNTGLENSLSNGRRPGPDSANTRCSVRPTLKIRNKVAGQWDVF